MVAGEQKKNIFKKTCVALVLAVSVFIFSACASLPTGGDVQFVSRLAKKENNLVFEPAGPVKGATAEQIVDGFLRASSVGYADDFQTARKFMVKELASKWNPLSKVLIYPDNQTYSLSQTPSGGFRLSMTVLASVDASGIYQSFAENSQFTADFTLVRDNSGEWRIALSGDGIVMPASLFEIVYAPVSLYFPAQTEKFLVADIRRYPRKDLLRSIAQGILRGPSQWIVPALRQSDLAGVKVSDVRIRASDSAAIIDLSENAAALPEAELSLLQAQYKRSFVSAGIAQKVILTSVGVPLNIEENTAVADYPATVSEPVAIHDGAVVKIAENSEQVETLISSEVTNGYGLNNLALGYSETLEYGVALDEAGSTLYLLDFRKQSLKELLSGAQLIPPGTDAYGWVWSGVRDTSGVLTAVEHNTGEAVSLKVSDLAGSVVKILKLSPEGSRAVIVYERNGRQSLAVTAVSRSGTGKPEALGELTDLGVQIENVRDLVWIDQSDLVLLARYTKNGEDSLIRVQLGGDAEKLNAIADLVGISASRGLDSLVAVDKSGILYAYTSGSWRKIAAGITSPAMSE